MPNDTQRPEEAMIGEPVYLYHADSSLEGCDPKTCKDTEHFFYTIDERVGERRQHKDRRVSKFTAKVAGSRIAQRRQPNSDRRKP